MNLIQPNYIFFYNYQSYKPNSIIWLWNVPPRSNALDAWLFSRVLHEKPLENWINRSQREIFGHCGHVLLESGSTDTFPLNLQTGIKGAVSVTYPFPSLCADLPLTQEQWHQQIVVWIEGPSLQIEYLGHFMTEQEDGWYTNVFLSPVPKHT